MIRVLEHGSKIRTEKIRCPHCGCKFCYDTTDIIKDYDRINAYESEYVGDYVNCPECDKKIWISKKEDDLAD